MTQQKFCQGCSNEQECQQAYQKLANFKGSSIVFKVSIAFLLPLITFIASLAVFEGVLAKFINRQGLQNAFSFLSAILVTVAIILITKLINRKFGENK